MLYTDVTAVNAMYLLYLAVLEKNGIFKVAYSDFASATGN